MTDTLSTSTILSAGHARPDAAPHVVERWTEQRRRRRMLYGLWAEDLREHLTDALGTLRRRKWPDADTSRCVIRDVAQAHATLYHAPPTVHRGRSTGLAQQMSDALDEAGCWALMQRVQRDTLAIREMHLHVGTRDDGSLLLTPAWPDEVDAEEHPRDPEEVGRFRWLKLRRHPETREIAWTWEVWDVRDAARPVWRIESAAGGDVTALYAVDEVGQPTAALVGDAYPWRDASGRPYIPVVTYHAQRTGQLYDWRTWHDMVIGTLNVGRFYTLFAHSMFNAAWYQRYSVGVDWMGQAAPGEHGGAGRDGEREIVADPAVVLVGQGRADVEGGSVLVGQWTPPTDPRHVLEAADSYTRTLYATSGLDGATISRVSGDPRSGYALAVTRAAQRDLQRTYAPSFRRSDLRLLRLCALALGMPEDGWSITYAAIEPSPSELIEVQSYVDGEIAAGRMSQITAYQTIHPGVDVVTASAILDAIATEADDERDDDGGAPADPADDEPDDGGAPAPGGDAG
jgi:hypothetical protein